MHYRAFSICKERNNEKVKSSIYDSDSNCLMCGLFLQREGRANREAAAGKAEVEYGKHFGEVFSSSAIIRILPF
jgi:hypothetical protein